MAASLGAAGLSPESAVIVTTLPEAEHSNQPAARATQFPTIRVPVLPTLPEELQHQQPGQCGLKGAIGWKVPPSNVETVAVPAAKEYPVLRLLCWHLEGSVRRAATACAHLQIAAEVQACMDQVRTLSHCRQCLAAPCRCSSRICLRTPEVAFFALSANRICSWSCCTRFGSVAMVLNGYYILSMSSRYLRNAVYLQVADGQWQPQEGSPEVCMLKPDLVTIKERDKIAVNCYKSAKKAMPALLAAYRPRLLYRTPLFAAAGFSGTPPIHQNLLPVSYTHLTLPTILLV